MTRAESRLRKIRQLERELKDAKRQWGRWYDAAKAARVTLRKAKRMIVSVEHRLANGKQRDR